MNSIISFYDFSAIGSVCGKRESVRHTYNEKNLRAATTVRPPNKVWDPATVRPLALDARGNQEYTTLLTLMNMVVQLLRKYSIGISPSLTNQISMEIIMIMKLWLARL